MWDDSEGRLVSGNGTTGQMQRSQEGLADLHQNMVVVILSDVWQLRYSMLIV